MPAKPAPAKDKDFELAFQALKRLLKPYAKQLHVTADEPGNYMTETRSPSFRGKPLGFAGVLSKSYVAFHFVPGYMFPELLKDISPDLPKRMQGKTCWNFKRVDEKLFAELGQLVEAGFRRYQSEGYL
jgi:hypothetical protein